MKKNKTTTVLFTGYAPVHFLCFRPIFEELRRHRDVELFLSGGLRTAAEEGYHYDGQAMYSPFGIPEELILPVEAIQDRHFDVLFSANKKILAPPDNYDTRVQIFHGVSFRNRGVRPENLIYTVFFLTGPYMRQKCIESGLVAEGDPRLVPIGFPKTDPLVAGGLDRDALLAQYGFDGTRPVLLYAPSGEAHNSLESMGKEVIDRLSATDRYDLIVKMHDHPKNTNVNWFEALAPLEGAHTRVVSDLDVIPLLHLADLLITDASSVANEYALLDRPIVYLDVPELIRESREKGALVDLETWGRRGGVVVPRAAEVEAAVAASLAEPERLSEVRSAIAQNLFYNPGRATEAAMTWFADQFLK